MARKNYYYVLVMTASGPTFVTGIGDRHTAYWDKEKAPYQMSRTYAEEVSIGLNGNGYLAYVVCSHIERSTQPYCYEYGRLKFVRNEDLCEEDN